MPKPILIWPDRVLSARTRPVTEFGSALDPLLEEMMESLRAAEGPSAARTGQPDVIGGTFRVGLRPSAADGSAGAAQRGLLGLGGAGTAPA